MTHGNRTQEADGSIPFISTEVLGFIFSEAGLKRFAVQSFQASERSGGQPVTFQGGEHASLSGARHLWGANTPPAHQAAQRFSDGGGLAKPYR